MMYVCSHNIQTCLIYYCVYKHCWILSSRSMPSKKLKFLCSSVYFTFNSLKYTVWAHYSGCLGGHVCIQTSQVHKVFMCISHDNVQLNWYRNSSSFLSSKCTRNFSYFKRCTVNSHETVFSIHVHMAISTWQKCYISITRGKTCDS